MAKLKGRELKMILAVTEPGEAIDSSVISDRIFDRFKRRFSKREIGMAISWSLNTRFRKTKDSQRRYTFTRMREI